MAFRCFRWFQDNASVTVDVFVPPETRPMSLRLLLTRRRLTLRGPESAPLLLRRRLYAPIEPRCADCYTMPTMPEADGRA
jgi:hypothetical protein